jgi:Flp pilus assembly protein TadD
MKPDVASALSNRALILAAAPDDELLNAEQALQDAQSARQIDRGQPAYADSLAIALAANGEFERAAAEATRAIDLLPAGNDDTLQRYQERLTLFQAGNSYRIPGE